MHIAFDLDNVPRKQIEQICHEAYFKYGKIITPSMFNKWDPPMGHYLGISDEEFTAWAWTDKDIFRKAQSDLRVLEIMKDLESKSHTVSIITSTACPELTLDWLNLHKVVYHNLVQSADKSKEEFDWLVDDSPSTLERLHKLGRKVLRFDLPWNRYLNYIPEFYTNYEYLFN